MNYEIKGKSLPFVSFTVNFKALVDQQTIAFSASFQGLFTIYSYSKFC